MAFSLAASIFSPTAIPGCGRRGGYVGDLRNRHLAAVVIHGDVVSSPACARPVRTLDKSAFNASTTVHSLLGVLLTSVRYS